MMDILQNPMFIAIVAGTLTYIYMWWVNKNRYSRNPAKRKPVNIIIPAIVTFVTWALVCGYYSSMEGSGTQQVQNVMNNADNLDVPRLSNKTFKLMDGKGLSVNNANEPQVSSESVRSYQLVGRGLNIPNNLKLPDVFIETF